MSEEDCCWKQLSNAPRKHFRNDAMQRVANEGYEIDASSRVGVVGSSRDEND